MSQYNEQYQLLWVGWDAAINGKYVGLTATNNAFVINMH